MKIAIDFMLRDRTGKELYRRWKSAVYDEENEVFMTIFDEDLAIERGDVLIGQIYQEKEC